MKNSNREENVLGVYRLFASKVKPIFFIPSIDAKKVIWSWVGSFICIATLSTVHNLLDIFSKGDLTMMIGSFGASAVLAYGAIDSPLAQPKNIIGGHILSALVGVTAFKLFGGHIEFASSVAVATSIAVMQITKTLHPPGGATALIAVIGGTKIHSLGYLYAVLPSGIGAVLIVLIAILINNIPQKRSYPSS